MRQLPTGRRISIQVNRPTALRARRSPYVHELMSIEDERRLRPHLGVTRNNVDYDKAAELAGEIGDLMRQTSQSAALAEYLEAVHTGHKTNGNFMRRIDTICWGEVCEVFPPHLTFGRKP
jgi:hypothetical protein